MFALDHIHYARWLTIRLSDLLSLEKDNKELYNDLIKGGFIISKIARQFSKLAIDQAHKQNNKLVKIDGGAIGILENESALLKRAIAGPTICDILKMSDSVKANVNELLHHHEDTKTFEVKFQKDKNAFANAIEDLGNPFLEEEQQLVHIVTKQLLDEKASKSIKC